MYNLALVEQYNDKYHGRTKCSSNDIENNYMIVYIITPEEFYNDEYIVYKKLSDNNKKIMNNDINTSLEIVQVLELNGLEQVGIIKTLWLKILQRKIRSFLIFF